MQLSVDERFEVLYFYKHGSERLCPVGDQSFPSASIVFTCEQTYTHTHTHTHTHSWTTLGWPSKISDQVETQEEQLEQDQQKFQKKLLDDQTQLDDKLDSLQV